MNKVYDDLINNEFEKLMSRLEGSLLYGIPFDRNNIRHLVVFTYYIALFDRSKIARKEFYQLFDYAFPKTGE